MVFQFLGGLVRHSPDVYLAELQELIEDNTGTAVSESTIWRSLKRSRFTMKKVRIITTLQLLF
jgi:transposase